jgi:wyosine [tRNA(Phe)-imidazoG37] synthetase (radical SAM superfamily)
LGVDLVPFKTCSLDCIYCQIGCTTKKTTKRKEWAPLDEALAEMKKKLPCEADYVTLSGSGEPTLHAHTGEAIRRIKTMTSIPVAVLTNGTLLWREDVRTDLLAADLVVPSLDAGDEAMFQAVNRPDPSITFEKHVAGLEAFRREFDGQYWLEIVLLAGHNVTDTEVGKLAAVAERLTPDRIQLNTAVRPPAESYATAVSVDRLEEIAIRFRPRAEVVAAPNIETTSQNPAARDEIVSLLKRRPCTLDDIVQGLGIHRKEAAKYIEHLVSEGRASTSRIRRALYYRVDG